MDLPLYFLLPATNLGKGYIFTSICDSVHGGGSAPVHAGIPSPQTRQAPPHPDQAGIPPRTRKAPPRSRAYWEIRSTSGRCASYWNAIFFSPCKYHVEFTLINYVIDRKDQKNHGQHKAFSRWWEMFASVGMGRACLCTCVHACCWSS